MPEESDAGEILEKHDGISDIVLRGLKHKLSETVPVIWYNIWRLKREVRKWITE